MGLTQTVAPTIEPVTLAEARDHLHISSIDDDTLIGTYITAAREYVEGRTCRQLINATWQWTLDTFPPWMFYVPRSPLVSAATAQISTVEITAYDGSTTYKLTVGSETISAVGDTDAATTATNLAAAWNAATHANFTGVTASAASAVVTLTADLVGVPFTATSSVSGGAGTIGTVATPTATAGIRYIDTTGTLQTLGESLYVVDTDSIPGRIVPAYNESWPSLRGDIDSVIVTFLAGYGTATSDVPSRVRVAIMQLVAQAYELRESVSPTRFHDVPGSADGIIKQIRIPEMI